MVFCFCFCFLLLIFGGVGGGGGWLPSAVSQINIESTAYSLIFHIISCVEST